MAGIYIHVPFCAKRCVYCDFYSQTSHAYQDTYVESVVRELEERAGYVQGESIETIYFGGGTPSQLKADALGRIFSAIEQHFNVSKYAEVTLEANPDDLTEAYLNSIRRLPFNRISLGVQSFNDDDLRRLNRRHDRNKAQIMAGTDDIHNILVHLIELREILPLFDYVTCMFFLMSPVKSIVAGYYLIFYIKIKRFFHFLKTSLNKYTNKNQ